MKHYALIGTCLTHSYSKQYFDLQHFPGADYRLHELPSVDGLRQWVERESISGFNVTVPYKQAVLPHLDALSPEAEAIGAVNCVAIEEGRLVGHNTDAPAFRQTMEDLLNTEHLTLNTALILGTGGAAHAVAYALEQIGIPYTFVSRTPERHPNTLGYNQLPTIHYPPHTLIVNATPVGMHPASDATPLPLASVGVRLDHVLLYDLTYNPSPTRLMREAAALGARTVDGLAMLHRQAELSWHLWHLTTL